MQLKQWNAAALAGPLIALLLASSAPTAAADATTWYVVSANDGADDGDLETRSGTLRFALAHADSGDFVSFAQLPPGVTTIVATSPLLVPAGVAVGHRRDEDCGDLTHPLINIEDTSFTLKPVFELGTGATLRAIDISGGDVSLKIVGPDVDVCAVGMGVAYYPAQSPFPRGLPPRHAALLIDGAQARVHRSYIGAALSLSPNSSDSLIGDAIGGEGEANFGLRTASVTVQADDTHAAQRVSIRDAFPRALQGLVGAGVAGGDDLPNHANNWAQTPTIISAYSHDGFATVELHGFASPNSLVDIFFDTQTALLRQPPVVATPDGSFAFAGLLPHPAVQIFAASTLSDTTYPNRVGSSSQWSAPSQVVPAPSEPLMAALGRLSNLSFPESSVAHPGDIVRLSVAITNVGTVTITSVQSSNLHLPPDLAVVAGSGTISGGSGFLADDSGFREGVLPAGARATYTLDLRLAEESAARALVVSLQVGGVGVIGIPVVGRIAVEQQPVSAPPALWLPLVES